MSTKPEDHVTIPAEHLAVLLQIANLFADTAPDTTAAYVAVDSAAKILRDAGREVTL